MDKSLKQIKDVVAANKAANTDNTFEGLTSSEIGEYSRSLMFGDDDEAFPSQVEWSRVVD